MVPIFIIAGTIGAVVYLYFTQTKVTQERPPEGQFEQGMATLDKWLGDVAGLINDIDDFMTGDVKRFFTGLGSDDRRWHSQFFYSIFNRKHESISFIDIFRFLWYNKVTYIHAHGGAIYRKWRTTDNIDYMYKGLTNEYFKRGYESLFKRHNYSKPGGGLRTANSVRLFPKSNSNFQEYSESIVGSHYPIMVPWKGPKLAHWNSTNRPVKHPGSTTFNEMWYFRLDGPLDVMIPGIGAKKIWFSYIVPGHTHTHIRGIEIVNNIAINGYEINFDRLSKDDKVKVARACMFGRKYGKIYLQFFGFYLAMKQKLRFWRE